MGKSTRELERLKHEYTNASDFVAFTEKNKMQYVRPELSKPVTKGAFPLY